MTSRFDVDRVQHWRADATRYNMLWRLVPSMNHKLAGTMQSMSMLAGMIARQLTRAEPDMQLLGENASNIQIACKAAVVARADVLSWFQPTGYKPVSISDGVAQCVGLLAAELAIRGCVIDNRTDDAHAEVDQGTVRSLVVAALLAILDSAPHAVAIVLMAITGTEGDTTLVISWTRHSSSDTPMASPVGHAISWDDVHALAEQQSIAMGRTEGSVTMALTAQPDRPSP